MVSSVEASMIGETSLSTLTAPGSQPLHGRNRLGRCHCLSLSLG